MERQLDLRSLERLREKICGALTRRRYRSIRRVAGPEDPFFPDAHGKVSRKGARNLPAVDVPPDNQAPWLRSTSIPLLAPRVWRGRGLRGCKNMRMRTHLAFVPLLE